MAENVTRYGVMMEGFCVGYCTGLIPHIEFLLYIHDNITITLLSRTTIGDG